MRLVQAAWLLLPLYLLSSCGGSNKGECDKVKILVENTSWDKKDKFNLMSVVPQKGKLYDSYWKVIDPSGNVEAEYTGNSSHFFESEGKYVLSLSVKGDVNCDDITKEINVGSGSSPVSDGLIKAPSSGIVNSNIIFSANDGYGEYQWDFGDVDKGSQLAIGKTVKHKFERPGIYSVFLFVDGALNPIAEHKIEIKSSGPKKKLPTTTVIACIKNQTLGIGDCCSSCLNELLRPGVSYVHDGTVYNSFSDLILSDIDFNSLDESKVVCEYGSNGYLKNVKIN